MKRLTMLVLLLTAVTLTLAVTVHDIQYTTVAGTAGANDFGVYPSLYNLQTVTLNNVIVTEVGYGTTSTNQQIKFFVADQEGGPWSGVYVFRYGTGVQVGDIVNITSTVSEYYGFTELGNTGTTVTIVSHGNPLPAPTLIPTSFCPQTIPVPADVAAVTEAFESVLCKYMDATVTIASDSYQQFYVSDGTGGGQIDDSCYMYGHSWSSSGINTAVGTHYDQIVGILDYSYDQFGLCPRDDNDFTLVSNDDPVVLPDAALIGNYPNPFAGQTEIAYNLKSPQNVHISIYNLKGQNVRTLVNEMKSAQLHNVNFDGRDDTGKLLPAGVYFCKLVAGNSVQTRKLAIR